MTRSELVAFLKRQKYAVVASRDAAGQPQAAVVGIATSDAGELVFDTLGSTRKARNLRLDPRAAIVVQDGEKTLQLDGVADEPAGAERGRLVALYLAYFPDGQERLSWPGITHFRFRATWARYSDFATRPEPLVVELPSGLGA